VEALGKKERQDEPQQKTIKIGGFLSFTLSFFLIYFLAGFFKKSHLVYDQTQGTSAFFFLTLWITLI
jgi:ABC-type multidrug transport system permease subunit